jgi:hypothetical protein
VIGRVCGLNHEVKQGHVFGCEPRGDGEAAADIVMIPQIAPEYSRTLAYLLLSVESQTFRELVGRLEQEKQWQLFRYLHNLCVQHVEQFFVIFVNIQVLKLVNGLTRSNSVSAL